MNQEKMHKVYKNLLDLLNEYLKRDCSFVLETLQYKELDNFFKSFFGKEFGYEKIVKLYSNCFIYEQYIIKFSDRKIPLIVDKQIELVNSYFRQNFEFININNNKIMLYLGVEIQDFLTPNEICQKEEMYSLYVSLRNKGLIWLDANLGNAVNYMGKSYIVDIDYIYNLKDAIFVNQSEMSKEFEKKYKNSKGRNCKN